MQGEKYLKFLPILIIIVASFLRLWQLNKIPPSLSWDEISTGYNAYSVLETGRDEWGSSFPLSFRAYGDYKLPGYIYLDIPFVYVFGLNEWGVRFPSTLLGIGIVILTFLILKEVSNKQMGLWGAFTLAILPWSIILSRIALEAHAALFFTMAAVYTFLLSLKKESFLYLSALLFGLSLFCYNSSRLVTPLLVLLLTVIYWSKVKSNLKTVSISGLIFLSLLAIVLPHAFLQDSSARYRWTAILDEGAINRINELRGSSALPPMVKPLVFNKATYWLPEVIKNYLSHFNPSFLFLNGGSHYQFSIPGSGLLYPAMAPFILLGVVEIIKKKQRWQLFVLGWLFTSFIPAAITRDAPHALRILMVIPPLIIISTLGISFMFNDLNYWIKKNVAILSFGLVIIFLINLNIFWQNYSGAYVKNYSWSWQYGYSQVVDYIRKKSSDIDKIFITKKYGEPHEFLLFYLQYDPTKYQNNPTLVRYQRSDWYWVDRFDNFYFVNDWEIEKSAKCEAMERCLLITSPGNYTNDWRKIETIDFLDGKPAFDILESGV